MVLTSLTIFFPCQFDFWETINRNFKSGSKYLCYFLIITIKLSQVLHHYSYVTSLPPLHPTLFANLRLVILSQMFDIIQYSQIPYARERWAHPLTYFTLQDPLLFLSTSQLCVVEVILVSKFCLCDSLHRRHNCLQLLRIWIWIWQHQRTHYTANSTWPIALLRHNGKYS